MSSIYRHIFSVILLLAVVLAPAHSIAQSNVKRVLVLNAYHEGFHWTDRIMKGIRSVFDYEEDIEIFIAYMDTKRSSDQEYFSKLRDLYAHRYRTHKFDAIVSSDDHALNFLLKYRDELFPGTPVFFSGINDFHPSRIANHKSFTGVFETYDVPGTLDLMLQVHPKTKKIAVITDATFSGNVFRHLVEKVETDFVDRIELNYLNNLSIGELKQKLGQLTDDTLVLWAMYLRTPEGRSISSEESVRIVTESSKRPTYCLWDVVGQGVVGGRVTSPNYQGAVAAEMALKFLRGTRIEDLPVSGSPMVYLFDFNAIRKFEIDENSLPPGSVILNRPFSIYDEYKKIIWTVSCFILTLIAVILALIYYIQKRRQAESALQNALTKTEETRDKIEAILKSVADGLIFTDTENRILLMSASAEGMLGRHLQDVFLQPMNAAIENLALQEQLSAIRSGTREGALVEFELPSVAEGAVRTIQAKPSVVKNKEGALVGVITQLSDVSRKRELDRMKSEFISTAAHELRTPLTSVRGYSQLLLEQKGFDVEQQAKFLSIIEEKSHVLEKIVDDMLNLSSVESGRAIHVEKDWHDLGPTLDELVSQYRRECKNHRFEAVLPENPVELMVDRGKIVQVMENLLSNAVKFSPEGSLVQVACKIPAREVQISVMDEGGGMTPEQVERVFDKFYRADSSLTAKEGRFLVDKDNDKKG